MKRNHGPARLHAMAAGGFLLAVLCLSGCGPAADPAPTAAPATAVPVTAAPATEAPAASAPATAAPAAEAPATESPTAESPAAEPVTKEAALAAYEGYLRDYAAKPALGGEETVLAEEARFVLLYLDGDEIPELAVMNGCEYENPVHLFRYDGSVTEVIACSLYGKLGYLPGEGCLLPSYELMPSGGEVLTFADGEVSPLEAWSVSWEEPDMYFLQGETVSEETYAAAVERWLAAPFVWADAAEAFPFADGDGLADVLAQADEAALALLAAANVSTASVEDLWVSDDAAEIAYIELTEAGGAYLYDRSGFYLRGGVCESGAETEDGVRYPIRPAPAGGETEDAALWDPAADTLRLETTGDLYRRYEDTGGGSGVRFFEIYAAADTAFLGEWSGDGGTLIVSAASPMAGGYALTLRLEEAGGEGDAHIEDGALRIHQGWMNGDSFEGAVERTDDGLRLTVTDSEAAALPAGTVLDFSRTVAVTLKANNLRGSG